MGCYSPSDRLLTAVGAAGRKGRARLVALKLAVPASSAAVPMDSASAAAILCSGMDSNRPCTDSSAAGAGASPFPPVAANGGPHQQSPPMLMHGQAGNVAGAGSMGSAANVGTMVPQNMAQSLPGQSPISNPGGGGPPSPMMMPGGMPQATMQAQAMAAQAMAGMAGQGMPPMMPPQMMPMNPMMATQNHMQQVAAGGQVVMNMGGQMIATPQGMPQPMGGAPAMANMMGGLPNMMPGAVMPNGMVQPGQPMCAQWVQPG